MSLFKKRAKENPEEQILETEKNSEEQILTAQLSGDEHITFDDAMKIPAFSACINKICDHDIHDPHKAL